MIERTRLYFFGIVGSAAVLFATLYVIPQAQSQAPAQIIGCVYNSSAPTLANRQTVAVQCDVNGNLKVTTTP